MIQQLEEHVHTIFTPYLHVTAAQELQEELLQNLKEKYNDYKQQGLNDKEAYDFTINSIGEVSELVESIHDHIINEAKQNGSVNIPDEIAPNSRFHSTTLRNENFTSMDLEGTTFSHSDLTDSTFTSSDLENCTFENVNFTSSSFVSSDLQNVVFKDCIFNRVNFTSCDLDSVIIDGGTFNQVTFNSCCFDNTKFHHVILNNVQFNDSDVNDIELEGVSVDKITYDFLRDANVNLSKVTLKSI